MLSQLRCILRLTLSFYYFIMCTPVHAVVIQITQAFAISLTFAVRCE